MRLYVITRSQGRLDNVSNSSSSSSNNSLPANLSLFIRTQTPSCTLTEVHSLLHFIPTLIYKQRYAYSSRYQHVASLATATSQRRSLQSGNERVASTCRYRRTVCGLQIDHPQTQIRSIIFQDLLVCIQKSCRILRIEVSVLTILNSPEMVARK